MQRPQGVVPPIKFDAEALAGTCEKFGIDLVVLFGSRAVGEAREDSDMDVAVRFRDGRPELMALLKAVGAIEDLMGPKADVGVLNEADPLFMWEVADGGIPLYEAHEDAFLKFLLYARGRYADTQKFRDMAWEMLCEQLEASAL